MPHISIRKTEYLAAGQFFHWATVEHYRLWFTGNAKRHKRTEIMLPRLVRERKLNAVHHGRKLAYAVPRITKGANLFVEHGLACTEGLVRIWRSRMEGTIIPERHFRGMGIVPEWGIVYPNDRMILYEFCSADNFYRARLVEGKITRYRQLLSQIESRFRAEGLVLFVIDVLPQDVERLVKRLQPRGPFFFTDYATFRAVPIGRQLAAPIYLWGEDGKRYPLKPEDGCQLY
jgi:hypothetical protein